MQNKPITILAISGSLRNTSANTAIVKTIKNMVPWNVEYKIYDGLANIPPFNDPDDVPVLVDEWRNTVAAADVVLFCSPEYAFGVPGTLKNALDWTVGSVVFSGKRVALITAASGGDKAHASLLNTLTALGTNIIDQLLIPHVRTKLDEKGFITHETTLLAVRALVEKLISSDKDSEVN
ncbi:MAG: NAD(P)H-dependent oxidoreductase [Ferruginibacter sp.]